GGVGAGGPAAPLGGRDAGASSVRFTLPPGMPAADLPPVLAAARAGGPGGTVEARATSPLPLLGALAAWAQARHVDLPDLQVIRPALEDIYLQLTREPRCPPSAPAVPSALLARAASCRA